MNCSRSRAAVPGHQSGRIGGPDRHWCRLRSAAAAAWRTLRLGALGAAWLLAMAGLWMPALAATAAASETAAEPGEPAPSTSVRTEAPVTVLNRTVTVFRAPLLGVSPADRAARTERTIHEILDKGGPGTVTTQTSPNGVLIQIDGELALILAPDDTDRLRDTSLDATAQAAVAKLEQVIAETQELRDRGRLARSVAAAAAATLAFGVAIWLVWRARRWMQRRATEAARRAASGVSVGGAPLLHGDGVAGLARGLVLVLTWLLVALFVYEWLGYVLSQFPYTRPWGEGLTDFLLGVGIKLGRNMLEALPNLFVAAVMFIIAKTIIGLVDPYFDLAQSGRAGVGWLQGDLARPTRHLFRITVWLFTIAMAYPYLPGAETEAFKGISVLVGLAVTVGGSGLFGQAFSGLVLLYSRTIKVGEYVRINEHEGTVTELRTFTTRIRTGLGEELTLPNSLVMATVTKNYSRTVRGPGYIVDTVVSIGYDTPWRQVEALLIEAARRTDAVLADPAPQVFQTALSDFYAEYRLVCQATPERPRPRAQVLAALHANIQDVFNERGIQIMSPHYRADPAQPKIVPVAQWYEAPATKPSPGDPGGDKPAP